MAEFRAFPTSGGPHCTYMLIRLNKQIFRWPACSFDPDFFWAQFGSAASAPGDDGFRSKRHPAHL
ncbi:hypothetical protein MPL3356_380126 [Mesorhizobium plurifarium]|uniref:Uncharacterized protein n=1 Tax=Mesorhizobium plurifarium TaxID=69974 RepID=A0A090GW25_MESPL|nr:hypothetical protein MPL3356_380126 [Mesorhizobium plurifarium]CDX62190.1 hypothetical protein MPL3365_70295 [Mesorhizobium plurifarium]